MKDIRQRQTVLYPLGITITGGEAQILVEAEAESVRLLLYLPGEEQPCESIAFLKEDRVGAVWSMRLDRKKLDGKEYVFEVDGRIFTDPFARSVTGRESWADPQRTAQMPRARILTEAFDWEDDRKPEIPYSGTILYRLHVRGFTKHRSSRVRNKGAFAGVTEKIPYLKELGITSVELMPVTEFDEVMTTKADPVRGGAVPTGMVNYWGYGPSFLFALKQAYGSGKKQSVETEFKTLVKSLHREGMECLVELYITGQEPKAEILQALRYWVQEYHVDGFRLSGFPPVELIAEDPFLKGTKLIADRWGEEARRGRGPDYGARDGEIVTVREKYLAECGGSFQEDMRRFLKGDEGMLPAVMFHSRQNPAGAAVIHSMADTNGFTMMDMVSYDRKHNEANGEDNRDGNDWNHSWNCGAEGPTKKKKIAALRRQQLKNAFLLLFLSQGTPRLLAGDEFGNSQEGNNNAYCQDNELSWLNWRLADTNRDLLEFVRGLIAFRKEHPVFHMEREPRMMDYRSLGRPDLSYHGKYAWKPETENFRRELGILYWGAYVKQADGSADDSFYVACNMHWEPHVFGLPRLPDGQTWHVVYDTSRELPGGRFPEGEEPALADQVQTKVPARCIMVLVSRQETGYYTYETPAGELTVCCRAGAVSGIRFGRYVPTERDMKEIRTRLSDQAAAQLTEYLEGKRKEFELPLRMEGSEFQKKVWEALLTIPYGETRSYKEIAAQIGDAKASRAVGMANNKNPIAIVVPCHRVVGADGSLTGYAGGVELKQKLLELERAGMAGGQDGEKAEQNTE